MVLQEHNKSTVKKELGERADFSSQDLKHSLHLLESSLD